MPAFIKPTNVEDLTGEQALLIVSDLREVLWPDGNLDAEHGSDTIEYVAAVEGLRTAAPDDKKGAAS